MKIIILGAAYSAGYEITQAALRRGHTVATAHGCARKISNVTDHPKVNINSAESIQRLLLNEFPDAIISLLAYPPKDPQTQRTADKKITKITEVVAQTANHLSARLIHRSSDLVFSGIPPHEPYSNTATPNPITDAGHGHLAAEKIILQTAPKFSTILRTPTLSGNSSTDITFWNENLLRSWANGRFIQLFNDELRTFLSVTNLADAIVELCERPNLTGIYHWSGTEALSYYDAAKRLAKHFSLPFNSFYPHKLPPPTQITRDLSLDLHPLRGKLKTPAQNFDSILAELTIPEDLRLWHALLTRNPSSFIPRFIKGIDF